VNGTALSGAPTIMAGTDWWPSATVQREVVATSDGKLYKDDMTGAFATTLKSGLGTSKVTQFVEGGGEAAGSAAKLFIPNGFNVVQVLAGDGATTADLTTPPADWAANNQPSFMFLFRNVMVGGGNLNFPHQLYASLGSNHEDYTAVGTWTLSVYPGKGQRLVAGLVAFGRAWVWKFPKGIWYIEDSASAVSGWYVKEVSSQYGAAPTPHAAVQIDESVVAFVNNTGSIVLMQESAGSLTGVTFTDLTKVLNLRQIVRDQFNLARLDRVQTQWDDDKKQLHVIYAAAGTTVENRRLVIDFNQERTRVEVTQKDVNEAIWLTQDSSKIPRLRSGDNAGFVWKLNQDARTVAGANYAFVLRTAPSDFSDVDPRFMGLKLFRRLHLEFEPTGAFFSLDVEVFIDGRTKGIVTFQLDPAGAVLPFTLPVTLGGDTIRRKYRALVGEGHYFSMRAVENGGNNPRLARAYAEFDLIGAGR